MSPDAKSSGSRTCPECGYLMGPADESCLRCVLLKADEEPPGGSGKPRQRPLPRQHLLRGRPRVDHSHHVRLSAGRPTTAAGAGRQTRHMDRPSEVTLIVILLGVSIFFQLYGAFADKPLFLWIPNAFASTSTAEINAGFRTAFSLGIALAIINLLAKSAICYGLYKMLPWARRVAFFGLIVLFVIGFAIKGGVTKSFIAAVDQHQMQEAINRQHVVEEINNKKLKDRTQGGSRGEAKEEKDEKGREDLARSECRACRCNEKVWWTQWDAQQPTKCSDTRRDQNRVG